MLEFEKPIIELEKKIEELRAIAQKKKIDLSSEIKKLEEKIIEQKKAIYSSLTAWQKTLITRHIKRPRTLDYVERIFTDFTIIHGDRLFRDDPAIVAGLAELEGEKVVFIGHQKGKDTKDNIYRNFGMAHPEGYRKALRAMKLAEKFNKPVISFIDTPAAYPGIGSEERGVAEAIARNLREMASLRTQIIVVIHGEGGSGGALGIGVGDKILMLEHAIYSVIPPEGCAAILWRDSSRAPEAAEALKITAKDLYNLGIIDEIIPEPLGGAHYDYDTTANNIKNAIVKALNEVKKINIDELIELRYKKFRKMGEFDGK
jgi:acetyl-CoA carboxylase carboxyl transferase subunit alpha